MMQKSPRHFNNFQNVKNLEETTILKKNCGQNWSTSKKNETKNQDFLHNITKTGRIFGGRGFSGFFCLDRSNLNFIKLVNFAQNSFYTKNNIRCC
jgi:hypothetical protein